MCSAQHVSYLTITCITCCDMSVLNLSLLYLSVDPSELLAPSDFHLNTWSIVLARLQSFNLANWVYSTCLACCHPFSDIVRLSIWLWWLLFRNCYFLLFFHLRHRYQLHAPNCMSFKRKERWQSDCILVFTIQQLESRHKTVNKINISLNLNHCLIPPSPSLCTITKHINLMILISNVQIILSLPNESQAQMSRINARFFY